MIYLGFAYLLVHFLSYVLYLRHVATLGTEKGIFLFHLVSFVAILPLAFALGHALDGAGLAVMLAVGSAHGLYSLSFLELWSLAEGSYSFKILNAIARQPGRLPESVISDLSRVGESKKEQRLSSLRELRLVEQVDAQLRLTRRGQLAAGVIRALRWLANLRETG